ncbi:MAG: light-harvesting antenna LH1, alpha subunit [Pseudomonadota bacterium]
MYRAWQMIHPMRALTMLYIALALLAFTIHFILLSTERYNWLKDPGAATQSSYQIERTTDFG